MTDVRTCVGCRGTENRSSLVRIVAVNGRAVVDSSATMPGRGAWLHPRRECVAGAQRNRKLARALRLSSLDVSSLQDGDIIRRDDTGSSHQR